MKLKSSLTVVEAEFEFKQYADIILNFFSKHTHMIYMCVYFF